MKPIRDCFMHGKDRSSIKVGDLTRSRGSSLFASPALKWSRVLSAPQAGEDKRASVVGPRPRPRGNGDAASRAVVKRNIYREPTSC
eukprot:6201135-Pleurochrysis_carterae.AAC.1